MRSHPGIADRRAVAAVILAIAALLPCRVARAEPRPYVLGVVPSLPPVHLYRLWSPFAERLARDSGVPIQLRIRERMTDFLADADAGLPDLLFAAPNMFFLSHQRQGYIPLVRSSRMLSGQLFVRRSSPYRSLRDLDGKTIAFVGPSNVCSVITRQAIALGESPPDYSVAFAGSAINVVKGVLLGKSDAGATLDSALAAYAPDAVASLRILLETPPIAPHPLAAHPRVPAETRERIAAAVLAMAATEDGARLLANVRLADPIRADYRRDYQHFASVPLERLAGTR